MDVESDSSVADLLQKAIGEAMLEAGSGQLLLLRWC